MNRVVVHEEGKRSAARAGEKGSPPNKMRDSHATHSMVKECRYLLFLLVILNLYL